MDYESFKIKESEIYSNFHSLKKNDNLKFSPNPNFFPGLEQHIIFFYVPKFNARDLFAYSDIFNRLNCCYAYGVEDFHATLAVSSDKHSLLRKYKELQHPFKPKIYYKEILVNSDTLIFAGNSTRQYHSYVSQLNHFKTSWSAHITISRSRKEQNLKLPEMVLNPLCIVYDELCFGKFKVSDERFILDTLEVKNL